MDNEVLGKLRCSACGAPFSVKTGDGLAVCGECGHYMAIDDRILEDSPSSDGQLAVWDAHYSEEDQSPLIGALQAGFSNPGLLYAHYPLVRLVGNLSLPLESSIELGCGSGAFSLVLKKLGMVKSVTLLDYSRRSLEAAGRLFERFDAVCNLVHARLESAPFESGSFDLALSAGVIEHYRASDERLGCLEAHLEVAKVAFVQAPAFSPCYWLSRAVYTLVNGGWPFGYERPVTLRELRGLAARAGACIALHDHQYFLSFPLFTRLKRLANPGWYTRPFKNEIAILARKED